MLKLKLQYLDRVIWRTDSLEKTLTPGKMKVGGEGDDRGWDGGMASLTRWPWVWVGCRSWWWIGKPGVLQSVGWQRVRHDWATELNWCGSCSTIVVNQLLLVFIFACFYHYWLSTISVCFLASAFSSLILPALSPGVSIYVPLPICYFLLITGVLRRQTWLVQFITVVPVGCFCLGPPPERLICLGSSNPKIKHLLCLICSVQRAASLYPASLDYELGSSSEHQYKWLIWLRESAGGLCNMWIHWKSAF